MTNLKRHEAKSLVDRRSMLRAGVATAATLVFRGTGLALGNGRNSIPQVKLNNSVMMPVLGFGTYGLRDQVCKESVSDAIRAGYRLIDTAKVYQNEEAVGAGIKDSGIDRKALFVTSKIWVEDAGYEPAKRALQTSLDKLQVDYLDLYLIHRPRGDVQGSWRAMEELNAAGKIRAIGVSNFDEAQASSLAAGATTKPVINQLETHPFFQRPAGFASLPGSGIRMEAWSPFAEGRNGLFTNPVLEQLAAKHGKTVAQIVLRWHHQRGFIAIPRSSDAGHRRENLAIFDFSLSGSDMEKIAALDEGRSQFPEWT